TVQAYMDVYLNRQIVALREKNLAFLNEQVRSNRARFDVGEGTRTDVAQAEASQATAVNDRNTARANVKIAEATYIQTVGATPGSLTAAATAKSLPKSL
ncbi:TolC family protein, partial [Enterobacter hormaechei]|nr:TolC family protein [Enterobacter hormaechei]